MGEHDARTAKNENKINSKASTGLKSRGLRKGCGNTTRFVWYPDPSRKNRLSVQLTENMHVCQIVFCDDTNKSKISMFAANAASLWAKSTAKNQTNQTRECSRTAETKLQKTTCETRNNSYIHTYISQSLVMCVRCWFCKSALLKILSAENKNESG